MGKRTIVHVEIPAADRAEAAAFYSKLFGWEMQDMPEMNYTTFSDGKLGGGFNPLGDDVKPDDVRLYIESGDIEADLRAIVAAGGKVVIPKSEIPTVGWFAWFSDPTGNILALYTSMNPQN
jgi:hypothetical protein